MAGDLTSELTELLARRSAAQAGASGLSPAQVGNLQDLNDTYPQTGGALIPLALAGVPASSPVAAKVAQSSVAVRRARKKVGEETTGGVWSRLWGGTKDFTKSVVRYGAAGAVFPVEVVLGTARAGLAEAGFGEGAGFRGWNGVLKQTTIGAGVAEAHDRGILKESLLSGWRSDVDEQLSGDGWFIGPDTPTGKRQAREAAAVQTVDGHAGTIGRNIAHGVGQVVPLEPGTFGYNAVSGTVDFTIALSKVDPVNAAGKSLAGRNAVRNVMDRGPAVEVEMPTRRVEPLSAFPKTRAEFDDLEVGLVDATRKTVLPEKFASWLQSDAGGRTAQGFVDIAPDDPEAFTKVWRGTGKKMPAELVVRLVDATDVVDVKNVLADAAADGQARDLIKLRSKRPPARLAGMMPGDKADLDDLDDVVEQADRMMRNARLPEPEISATLLNLARSGTKGERFQLIRGIEDSIKKTLVASGLKDREAENYVRSFSQAREGNRLYHVDMVADGATVRSFRLGDTDIEIAGPHLSVQVIDRHMPLPSAREIKNARRQWEWLRDVQASAPYKMSATVLDFVTQDMFKPLALLPRIAYPIRVVGEEQARIGSAPEDYAAMFHHPLSYIALLIGDKPTVATHGVDAAGKEVSEEIPNLLYKWYSKWKDAPNLGGDALGGRFDEEDLVAGISQWQKAMSKDSGGWVDRVIQGTARHWVPIMPDNPEFIDGWHSELIQSASDQVIRELARHGVEKTKDLFWHGNLQAKRKELAASLRDTKGRAIDLNDKQIADAYLEAEWGNLLKLTGQDSDLMYAVGHASLRGNPLSEGLRQGKGAHKVLTELLDAGRHPKVVRGQVQDAGAGSPGRKILQAWEDTVQDGFRLLMSIPTNRLSRSKVFKQAYWNRMGETLPLLTKSEQVRLIRSAKEAGIPSAQVKALREQAKQATAYGKLTVEKADHLSKAYALDETRQLLYSLHEKAQIADALRVVYPFGEAWREVLTRWTRIAGANPKVMYRTTQALQAGRESGFFYPDPQTGQEMFAIPGSEWITEKLVGVPMKLDMPVAGLNMFGTVLPGAGPAVTYPASKMLPDSPTVDFVRQMILPFGDPDTGGGSLESLFPSYWRKLQAGLSSHASERSERQLLSTTRDVAAYLVSTGKYDLSTPEGQARLQEDAKEKGRALFIIRAIAQGVAPSPPSPHFYAKDKTGALHTLYELQNDYRKFQDANFETATERFIDKWGEAAFLGTISKTTGPNAPTGRVQDFARHHPAQAKMFPNTYGLFAPGGDIAPGETERQILESDRDVVETRDAITLSNIRMANWQYQRAQAKVGPHPSPAQQQWLWTVQDVLVNKYPGYTGTAGDLSKAPGSVNELIRASKDPVLASTPAGRGLVTYLAARDRAQQAARGMGYKTFKDGQDAQPWRDWLVQVADAILQDTPQFVEMWDRVLSREVEN